MKNEHKNDCEWKDKCLDADNVICCEEYRKKAQNHCFISAEYNRVTGAKR